LLKAWRTAIATHPATAGMQPPADGGHAETMIGTMDRLRVSLGRALRRWPQEPHQRVTVCSTRSCAAWRPRSSGWPRLRP
jgi:hypothetical protein